MFFFFFLGFSRTTAAHHLLLFSGYDAKTCVFPFLFWESTRSPWGFFFLLLFYYRAATQASAKCLTIHSHAKRSECSFRSPVLRSSKREVVTTRIIILIRQTTKHELPWRLWGGRKQKKNNQQLKSIKCISVFIFVFKCIPNNTVTLLLWFVITMS